MNTIMPKKLKKGDTIGIISLCGAVKDEQRIYKAKNYLESRGYKVVLSDNIFDKNRYLAGSDNKKLECLHEFFLNPQIDAILCSRGGYGAIRLINDIDYTLIRNNPKIFAGYSDVTALSAMFLRRAGLITFSAPMANGDFGINDISEYTCNNFFDTLSNTSSLILKSANPVTYFDGKCEGILFGGNLATIVSLCGVDFIPDVPFIFFAEDLNEDVYRIDKMFHQLFNIPKFLENLSGIVLGEFLDVSNTTYLQELFYEISQNIQKPVLGGFKISHDRDKLTIPIGAKAILDTKLNQVETKSYLQD
jgi:muramoyltetrapeptide carboxypeptidase